MAGAKKGNQFWKARSSHGAKPKFKDPEPLWEACQEYFQWVEDNPLKEDKGYAFQGVVTHDSSNKMRAMTIGGLCIFLDIDETTWREWAKSRTDLSPIITRVESIIYNQKFTGAAADLLNPNIIARELGLSERVKTQVTGADDGPIDISTPAERLAGVLDGIASRKTS